MLSSFEQIVMDGISDMIFVIKVEKNNDFSYEFLNKAALEKSNLGDNVVGLTIRDIYPPTKAQILYEQYTNVASTKKCLVYEDSYSDASGRQCYTESIMTPLFDEDGHCNRIVTVVKDITEQLLTIEKLEQSEKRFRIITENAQDLITLVNHEGKITYVSPSYKKILGYHHKEYIDKLFFHNIYPNDIESVTEKISEATQKAQPFNAEFRQYNSNGELLWFESNGQPIFNHKGALEYLVVLTRDITLRKEYESKLRHFAYHDSLTGLPNRLLFKEKFTAAKEQHLQNQDGLALIMLDIDDFKLINDSMGHDFGDLVIKEFGNRLCQTIREKGIVARLGGDEFIILLLNNKSKVAIIKIAEDIFQVMKKPLNIQDKELEITTSMGIAIAPVEYFSKKSLLKNADIALYKAKENGKNSYFIYEDDE